jgi:hypothetical protein
MSIAALNPSCGLEQFEDFCTVSQNMRRGVLSGATVMSADGRVLKKSGG